MEYLLTLYLCMNYQIVKVEYVLIEYRECFPINNVTVVNKCGNEVDKSVKVVTLN